MNTQYKVFFYRAPRFGRSVDPVLVLQHELMMQDAFDYSEAGLAGQLVFKSAVVRGHVSCEMVQTLAINSLRLSEDFVIPGPFPATSFLFHFNLECLPVAALAGDLKSEVLDPRAYQAEAFRRGVLRLNYERFGDHGNYAWLENLDPTDEQILRVAGVRPGTSLITSGFSNYMTTRRISG